MRFTNRRIQTESPSQVRASGGGSSGGGGTTGAQTMPTTPAPEYVSAVEETGFATTVYTKHLNLVAIDLQQYIKDIGEVGRQEAVPVEVWSVDIETTGQPSDLSEVFPVMMVAGNRLLAAAPRMLCNSRSVTPTNALAR